MKDIELFNDHFQNYKVYGIPKAQLVIADIPYNVGDDAYGSNPMWYKGGDNKNGESELAGKAFFDTDHNFKIAEFAHNAGLRSLCTSAPRCYAQSQKIIARARILAIMARSREAHRV